MYGFLDLNIKCGILIKFCGNSIVSNSWHLENTPYKDILDFILFQFIFINCFFFCFTSKICETLLSGRTVILNLEGLDLEVAQRIIDFTSGATFAINGNLQKISNYIFLVTPTNVDISGDLTDLLNTSFDVPSIKTRY